MRATAVLHQYIADKGRRWTAARARVQAAAARQTGHFDAEELWQAVNQAPGPRVSRATVYRTLPLLAACGLISETAGARGLTRYERVAGREHHDHLLCLGCGAIIELASASLEALQERECRRHGFSPVRHQLVISGYCRACADRQQPDRNRPAVRP